MTEELPDDSAEPILFAEFLERTPPGVGAVIADLFKVESSQQAVLSMPDIQLFCESNTCNGLRFFHCTEPTLVVQSGVRQFFLNYRCRNCGKALKSYALIVVRGPEVKPEGEAVKFGEMPPFGPPVPSRVITLIGPDREVFIRGRRSEYQGLGIGAFAYYRRVVENQKGRLIREIAKVAKRLGATPDKVAILEKAAIETQFSKAVDDIKDAIPQALLIDGHNPLKLLHSALSEGLHAGTDEQCLELATSIRVVLTELADRISQALKDETELQHAVTRLLQPKEKPSAPTIE